MMQIAATSDEMLLAFLGGLLLCIATSVHLLLLGRVTGFSGILFNIFSYNKLKMHTNSALVSGLVISSCALWKLFKFQPAFKSIPFFDQPEITVENLSLFGFALAGRLNEYF